jgi:hypothetical protein
MRHVGGLAVAGFILLLAAGCAGQSTSARTSAAGQVTGPATDCGTAYTAAQVAVDVMVPNGTITCQTALRIQRDYSRKLTSGAAPGNGGGGPVPVDGWVCQGYPTPQVLRTGRASQCHRGAVTFYAVLPAPASSPTP